MSGYDQNPNTDFQPNYFQSWRNHQIGMQSGSNAAQSPGFISSLSNNLVLVTWFRFLGGSWHGQGPPMQLGNPEALLTLVLDQV